MSQINTKSTAAGLGTVLQFTTDSGTVVPDGAGNVNLLGGANISSTGAGSTATYALSGTTDHAVQIGNVTGSLTSLGVATDGQLVIGSTGVDPVLATLTAGTDISITNAAGSITINSTASGGTTQFDGDSGSATPAAGIITMTGGSNMTSVAAGSSVTYNLDNTVSISGSMTAGTGLTTTTGNVVVSAGNILLPNTNASGTQGVISFGGNRFIHNRGTENTFVGQVAGNFSLTGIRMVGIGHNTLVNVTSGDFNVAVGDASLGLTTSGQHNVAVGLDSGKNITTGDHNTAIGSQSMFGSSGSITGSFNTGIGRNTLDTLTSGSSNIAIGAGDQTAEGTLTKLTTGNYNIAIGSAISGTTSGAGEAYTSSESSNICLGPLTIGTVAESNVMRLGTHGGGAGQQNKCFIAGIRGITTGVADAVAVLIDSAFQLGTASSSIRVKKNIEDMGGATNGLFDLRPVNFDYINSKSATDRRQYGLIAEEVEKIMPDLVVYDKSTLEPESVFYNDLPVMLLNEMKKLKDRIERLESNCTCNG